MNEFTSVGGDGDLQAVVRGFSNGFSTYSNIENNPPTCFAPLMSTIQQEDHDFVLSNYFPDLFESTTTVLDELEQLYKPFYPQTTFLSPPSTSVSRGEREPEKETFINIGPPVVAASSSTAHVVKQRRRKNQHKRVVLQVRAESLSSDMWAWRKYGQKPIKGSPHPRSYYRCSSSKGCLARKQVERSLSDPEMFVITYTAEHCHGQPTRRNSLAGTPRNKFSTAKYSTSGDPANSTTTNDSLGSPISSAAICPQTHSLEDELSKQVIKKESTEEEEEEEDDEKQMGDCNMVLGDDDFLVGFNELDRLTSDSNV